MLYTCLLQKNVYNSEHGVQISAEHYKFTHANDLSELNACPLQIVLLLELQLIHQLSVIELEQDKSLSI